MTSLSATDQRKVNEAIEALREFGPNLKRPLVDVVKSSRYTNMKELRPLGSNLRMLFAFDSQRRAIVLVAGDKSGHWHDWYRENISLADSRFQEHLSKMSGGNQ